MDWKKNPPPKQLFSVLTKTLYFSFPHPTFYFLASQLVAKVSDFPYLKAFLAEVHEDFLPLFLNARVNLLKVALPRVLVGVQCQISTLWLPPVHDSRSGGSPLCLKRRGHRENPTGEEVEIIPGAFCITCNLVELTPGG